MKTIHYCTFTELLTKIESNDESLRSKMRNAGFNEGIIRLETLESSKNSHHKNNHQEVYNCLIKLLKSLKLKEILVIPTYYED